MATLVSLTWCATQALGSGPDFNSDGRADLVIGTPFDGVGSPLSVVPTAGSVDVMYGRGGGLGSSGSQRWHQNTPGIGDVAQVGDQFGQAVAHGDFNGDGFDDLAIGAPFEDIGNKPNAGCAHVVYGSAAKLQAAGSQTWHQNKAGIGESAQPNDQYGWSLACGDFDGDGYDDLAIAAPSEAVQGVPNVGVVHVLNGSAGGLVAMGSKLFSQRKFVGGPIVGEKFGYALAAADFNADGFCDLAIGSPGRTITAGAVTAAYGSPTGIRVVGVQTFTQDDQNIGNGSSLAEAFGWTLAAGDIDNDGYADLIVGSPFETVGGDLNVRCGAISVIRGSADALTTDGGQFLTQGNVNGLTAATAHFGWSIAIGDFNGDGYGDVLAGAPLVSLPGATNAGAAFALTGSAAGLDGTGSTVIDQQVLGALSGPEAAELFGWSVRCGDYNGDGYDDVAIAAPFEDVLDWVDAGALFVIYSDQAGVDLSRDEVWVQSTIGTGNPADENEGFGFGRGP